MSRAVISPCRRSTSPSDDLPPLCSRASPARLTTAVALADGDVLPRLEVGRVEDQAAGDVHRAGRGDADGGDLFQAEAGGLDRRPDRLAHALQAELLTAVRLGRQADRADHPAAVLDDAP